MNEEIRGVNFDNLLPWIIEFEGGEMDEERVLAGFQFLVDSGLAWTLQGYYGRTAQGLIESGLIQAN